LSKTFAWGKNTFCDIQAPLLSIRQEKITLGSPKDTREIKEITEVSFQTDLWGVCNNFSL